MTVKIQKKIEFNNTCNCIVDYNELENAILWYIEKPVQSIKKIYIHGNYPAITINREKIHNSNKYNNKVREYNTNANVFANATMKENFIWMMNNFDILQDIINERLQGDYNKNTTDVIVSSSVVLVSVTLALFIPMPFSPCCPFTFLKARANLGADVVPLFVTVTDGVPTLLSTVADIVIFGVSPISPCLPFKPLKLRLNEGFSTVPLFVTVTDGYPVESSTNADIFISGVLPTSPFKFLKAKSNTLPSG